jgi:hypothetical protein
LISYLFIVVIPEWLDDLHQQHPSDRPMVQTIGSQQTSLPLHVPTPAELNEDGSYESAYGLICQSIQEDLEMANDLQKYNSYERSVLRKTGVKLPRYCGCINLPYHAVSWCYEIFDKLNFVAGCHGSNEEIDLEFLTAAERLVKEKVDEMPKDKYERPILIIPKPVVVASIKFYEFTKRSCIELFSSNDIDRFAVNRLVKNAAVREAAQQMRTNK